MDWPTLSQTLVGRLGALAELQAARHVLLYLAMPHEVRVEALADDTAEPARSWYVPRCAPDRQLAVYRYRPGSTFLLSGPFGIREPDPARESEVDPSVLDLVLVPALLLSEQGDRLGYGGGYYDRFLARLAPSCSTVGMLPDALLLPHLPRDPWDRQLGCLVTPNRVLRPGSARS